MSEQYKELLKIRRQRELTKTLRANKEKERLQEAKSREAEAQQDLNSYSEYKSTRQQEIYSTSTGIETDRLSLEKNRAEILRMAEQVQAKSQQLTKAQNSTSQQAKAWEEARAARLNEARGVQKFEHLLENQNEQTRKDQERNEEKKVEEIPAAQSQPQP